MATTDGMVPIRTEMHRDDWEWATRIAAKHDVSTDTILRMGLAYFRALWIAEIVTIGTITSTVERERVATPPAQEEGER